MEERRKQTKSKIKESYYAYSTLYLVQALLGIAGSIQSPAMDTAYSNYIRGEKETVGWAFYSTSFSLAIALGALLGSHLAHYLHFDAVFASISILSFAAFVVSAIFLPAASSHK